MSTLGTLEAIGVALGVVASVLGVAVSIWSARRTRQRYYDKFMTNRSEKDKKIGD